MQDPQLVQRFFTTIAPRYDLANHLLSGGLDYYWRFVAARRVASWRPAGVLDLATGSGDLALALQRHAPQASITGADFCAEMLGAARRKGVRHVVEADALRLPFADRSFDAVTVAFGLRNMESWPDALAEMRRVLRPGGRVVILDFSLPPAPWRGAYRFYLHRVLPRLAGAIAGCREAYEYLGATIEKFPSGAAMQRLLGEAGFRETTAEPLSGGIVSLYVGRR